NKFYSNAGEKPSFMINLGDIASWGPDLLSWEVFFDDISDVAPYYPLMIAEGNHEYGGDKGANYEYLMVHPTYYSFNYSGVHFISFNQLDGSDPSAYSISDEQLNFIRGDLARNKDKNWIIACFHVPVLSTDTHIENLTNELVKIFNDNHVDLVLQAHDHHYGSYLVNMTNSYNGTIYIVNGGGGAELDSYLQDYWGSWNVSKGSSALDSYPAIIKDNFNYAEISWGFVDVQVKGNVLNVSYYRWLDFQRFLNITGQPANSSYGEYSIPGFTQEQWIANHLDQVQLVHSLVKTRDF
ncbi:MAG: metallophosphoesterase family protein, partial [Promethearchaeota archaeon]